MFETLQPAPQDPILGLTETFRKDPNPGKINLSIGVYKDAEGITPIFSSVKRAEERLLREETSKDYLGMAGSPEYGRVVQHLLFGPNHDLLAARCAATAHTPGGTAALRVAADLVYKLWPRSRVWVSEPTWPNHFGVFQAAGLEVRSYTYYDAKTQALAFPEMLDSLEQVPAGDVVLFHASCHNPTGIDPAVDQWRTLAELAARQKFLPLFDFAYQGLADDIEEDAAGLREFCRPGMELLITSSFSKSFGLYNERVGALTLVGASEEAVQTAFGHVKLCIRANYSNPPAHGAAIVTTILSNPELRREWEAELTSMRNRINHVRHLFVERLKVKGVKQDFSFLTRQRGMFSYSGLTREQVRALREKRGIYILDSGRINVAGITQANLDILCEAIADVL